MPGPFVLTQAESDFIYHYRRETERLEAGPAHEWLRANGIYPSTLIPFLYFDQENNPRWLDRISEDPLPPFRPAWSSDEEFENRARMILEVYPKLKNQPYALPGFRPTHLNDAAPLVHSQPATHP
jgi:hypothetical protein